jgi:predicted transglutaminase-like cysteine proteinase
MNNFNYYFTPYIRRLMQVNTISAYDTAVNLFSTINGVTQQREKTVFDVLQAAYENKYTTQEDIIRDPAFINFYLQVPNQIVKRQALQIVNLGDSDDVKMRKIQRWVIENIEYANDKEQYGYDELWVPPVMLLQQRKGDCEDGAFLIMSLALNAGVDPTRLRFFGGLVKAGEGSETGGHGWVAYRRESDDEWVAVDFSYYPDLREMDKRLPLTDNMKYIDDYFIFEPSGIIIDTSNTNRIRNPDTYTARGYVTPNVLLPGTWVSIFT